MISRRFTSLRSVAPADLPLYETERALRRAGRQASLCVHAPACGYVAFEATWEGAVHEGWANFEDLVRHRYPALNDLAWLAVDKRYATGLFDERDVMTALPAPPGGWEKTRLVGLVECDLPGELLLCFDEPGSARAMFRRFPVVHRNEPAVERVGNLRLNVCFAIGAVRLPLALLPRIAQGDALLIPSPRFEVRVGQKRLCEFQCKGMDIVLNEQIRDEGQLSEPQSIGGDGIAGAKPEPFDVTALPVTLEFALREESMTVSQLASLHAGTVLPLGGPVGEVTIRANGRPFGRGELIQVGDHLAVEIKSVWLATPAARHGE